MTRYRNQTIPSGTASLISTEKGIVSTTSYQKPASLTRQMYDEVVPEYHKKSALGQIFNNPASRRETSFEATDVGHAIWKDTTVTPNGIYDYVFTSGYSLGQRFSTLPFPAVSLNTEVEAAKASLDCIASVNKTEVDSGNFMLEWEKTRSLHRDLGNAILKLATEGVKVTSQNTKFVKTPLYDENGNPLLNKRGKPMYKYSGGKSTKTVRGKGIRTKNAANLYLAVRMGVLPLLSDLEGACKALLSSKSKRQTARGRALLAGQAQTKVYEPAFQELSHEITLTTTRTWTRRYGILYESEALLRLASQFGLSRPLSSLWESLPWTFIVDWFLNVGRWLDAIQPNGASKIVSAWVSTHETTVYTASVKSNLAKTVWNGEWSYSWNGNAIKVVKTYSRDPWVPAVPSSPPFGDGFNAIRSLDFATLILQRLPVKF